MGSVWFWYGFGIAFVWVVKGDFTKVLYLMCNAGEGGIGARKTPFGVCAVKCGNLSERIGELSHYPIDLIF